MIKFIQKNLLVGVVVLVVFFGGAGYFLSQSSSENSETTNTTQESSSKIVVTIKADGSEKSYEVENGVGKTALVVTEEAATVVKTGEGENAFITSVNGRVASSDKKEFWKLVINGEDAQVGAGSYTVSEGDTITWEIDTF